MRKTLIIFQCAILRIVMSFPGLWCFLHNFFNSHFLCTVVGFIWDEQGRVLLLEHKYRPDPLALPAGFIKKGETPFETLKREIKEETNFEITPIRILNVNSTKTRPHLEFLVEADLIKSMFIPSKEVSYYCWIEKSELQDHSCSVLTLL